MKKRYWIPLLILLAIPIGLYAWLQMPVFGGAPTDEQRQRFTSSAVYNESKGIFENRRPELIEIMRTESSVSGMLKEWLRSREHGRPEVKLPEQIPDMAVFMEPAEYTKLIWLGHSTFLINIDGAVVLVDPVFSDFASPVSFIGKRFQPSVISLDELPEIDVVLLSHDHYDHLDKKSIEYFIGTQTLFLSPLGVGSHLQRWGVSPDRIVENDWWETHTAFGIEFTAAPSQHFSGRKGFDNNATLWASWIMASKQSRLYFSGDSGYDIHFKEIGERYGPFDLSILENGQFDKLWAAVHLFPEETVQAHLDLQAKRLMPVHWGMFELAFHTWYDPVDQLASHADRAAVELITPILGELLLLNESVETTRWWSNLVDK